MLALAHLPGWEDEKAWKVGFRLHGHSDSSLCFPESAEAESSRGQPRVCSGGTGAPKREGWVAVASECRNTATGIVVGIGVSDQGTPRARAVSMDPRPSPVGPQRPQASPCSQQMGHPGDPRPLTPRLLQASGLRRPQSPAAPLSPDPDAGSREDWGEARGPVWGCRGPPVSTPMESVNGQESLFAKHPPAARNREAGGLGFKCTRVQMLAMPPNSRVALGFPGPFHFLEIGMRTCAPSCRQGHRACRTTRLRQGKAWSE